MRNKYTGPVYVFLPADGYYLTCRDLHVANELADDLIGGGCPAFVADDLSFLSPSAALQAQPLPDRVSELLQNSVACDGIQLCMGGGELNG